MRFTKTEKRRNHPPGGPFGTWRKLNPARTGPAQSTFYNWYRAFVQWGETSLEPKHYVRQQWNTIPEAQRQLVADVALEHPALSPRELAVRLTDEQRIFISESSVYRILKAKGLVTTPAHILLSAGNEFTDKPCFVHELWQTDFTHFKILGWGWYYLSTILDDYSRFTQALAAL